MDKNFSIYRASAGSGKTYILTYNYIRLALQYPDYFKTVLAVTFTNKATEEMKSRILDTLKILAKRDHPMGEALMDALHITKVQLAQRADALLRSILHNYSFFAVTTIDTFFQKIVRSFAREIGIQTGFRIELDQAKVISEVIDQMLMEMTADPQLVKWLTDFAIYQINQGKSWDTRRDIKKLSSELFSEFLVLHRHEVFAQLDQPGFMDDFVRNIKVRREDISAGMLNIGRQIYTIWQEKGLNRDDFIYKAGGVGGYMEKIIRGELTEPKQRVNDALEEGKWYSKNSDAQPAIESALEVGLGECLSKAIDYYNTHHEEYDSLEQVTKYLYTFGLLSKISEEINNYRDAHDLLLISDFPVFLNEIVSDSDAPYIYEKVGTRYKHYLIDEFQDTSGLQWENFKPLVLDTLSAGNFSMVVGDIKQSIYRWRGGNWKILLDQIRKDIGEEQIKEEGLSVNRRSKQNIVTFNNQLFQKVPQMLEDELKGGQGAAMDGYLNLKAAYTGSTQHWFDESGDGLINLHFYEKAEVEDVDTHVISKLVNDLQALQEANYRLNDIVILVRNNAQGRKITKGLMAHQLAEGKSKYRYDVISNESLFLKNNPAVHLILQGLYWIQASGQSLSRAQLRYACGDYARRRGLDAEALLEGLISSWSEMANMNLSEMVHALIQHFRMFEWPADHAYVLAFQDLIFDYLQYEKDALSDFLLWWSDHDNRSIQVSEDQEAIRLMTVHKSKGLQFKAVILPYGDWKLDHSGTNEQLLWCDTSGAEVLNQVPFLPVRYKRDLENTVFSGHYLSEKSDVYLDNLNLLYVALTRAEEALYVYAQVKRKSKNMADVGDLIFKYCQQEALCDGMADGVTIGQWHEYSKYPDHPNPQFSLGAFHFETIPDRIRLRKQAHILEEAVVQSINYGEIIHWVFSLIGSKQDFTSALDKSQIKFGLSDKEMAEIKQKLRQIWNMPQISGWFDESWQVKNESSILLTNGKLKRPDRVIVKDQRAIVIDYKTGARSQGHIRQVEEYKSILHTMGYKEVEGYLIYLSVPEVFEVK